MVVVSGYDNVRSVMVDHWNEAANRPAAVHHNMMGELGQGVLNSEDDNWKAQRSASLTILREFGMGKTILAGRISEEVDCFISKLGSYNSKPVNFRPLINMSVSNVICYMTIGKRFDHDDPYFVKLIYDMNTALDKVPTFPVLMFLAFTRFLPFDLFGIKDWMKHMMALRTDFSEPYIEKLKKSYNKDETVECYITAYIQKMYQGTEKRSHKYLDEPNLIATIGHLFVAGTDTTSSTIYWAVLLCLHNPKVQDKVFEEIDRHVGRDRRPTLDDRPNLVYLEAVIKEVQRMSSILSLLPRRVTKTFELKGYTIPKNSIVMCNIYSSLNDANIWNEPHKFNPDRFLDAEGKLINPSEEYVPFGLGKRACLGKTLAVMELYLFSAAIFQRFRFEPENPGELPSLKGHIHIVRLPEEYKVKFVPRY